MAPSLSDLRRSVRQWLEAHLSQAQNRNAYYLMGSNLIGAAAGVAFWYLLAAVAGLDPGTIGVGHAAIALGTTIAVVAKGGLDTALVQTVPDASRDEALRLLRFGVIVGSGLALVLWLGLAGASRFTGALPDIGTVGWLLVGGIALLLVTTWLQDAYFLAERDAKFSMQRNIVFSAARLALPLPIVMLALTRPVALTWALALLASALAAVFFTRTIPERSGRRVPRMEFIRTSLRNVTGSAAEFLPGLLLVPIVLHMQGADAAGFFSIAWTAASLLFLASAAIGRSAMTEMVRMDPAEQVDAIRKSVLQHLWLIAPAGLVGVLLAPQLLSIFGPVYAAQSATTFAILCASILFVAPTYLYLSVLRALDRPVPLVVFPAAMVAALFALVPSLGAAYGVAGFAIAWFVANVPFGIYGAIRLAQHGQEVSHSEPAQSIVGDPHTE